MSKNILKFGIFGTADKGGGRNLGKINVSAVGENKGLGQFHRYQLHLALFLLAFQKFFGSALAKNSRVRLEVEVLSISKIPMISFERMLLLLPK
mgnify:CR=1 FL=1